jgi:hypothetical protein
MKTSETQGQGVPVTPIRKLLSRLPSLRRTRSRRTSSNRTVIESNAPTALTWSEFPTTPFLNGILVARTSATDKDIVPETHCSTGLTQPKRAQLAIQQYDRVHDAIVVSTLPYYPFCCHQDLIAMTRSRLLQTAYLFNSCLPFSGRFTDLEVSSDAYIRRRIEELVGIVPRPADNIHHRHENNVKAISDLIKHCESDMATPTPTSSPLASYPSRMLGSPRFLDVLVEEDESDCSSCHRTFKKRKFDGRKVGPSQVSFDRRSWD